MEPERFLSRIEAAAYINARGLKITKAGLAKMAVTGGGPLFRHFGHYVVYQPSELDAWIVEKLSAPLRSTSEIKARA